MIFFWGDHINQEVSRGPFMNSQDWSRARLALVINDQITTRQISDDTDETEHAERIQDIAERLLLMLPRVFPTSPHTERTILFHHDLFDAEYPR